jgi:type IV secretory pathway VirB4 component
MAMLRLKRIFKDYQETGSLNERVNLYGFVGPEVFLTKTGELGLILEVRGVDYECLEGAAIDALTKRLESALKLFGDDYRVYQYLFKRNNETIPYKRRYRTASPISAARPTRSSPSPSTT